MYQISFEILSEVNILYIDEDALRFFWQFALKQWNYAGIAIMIKQRVDEEDLFVSNEAECDRIIHGATRSIVPNWSDDNPRASFYTLGHIGTHKESMSRIEIL